MTNAKVEAMQEKAKERIEETVREKQEAQKAPEVKEEPKKKVSKKSEVKKPVVTEVTGRANFSSVSYKVAREVLHAIKGKPVKKAELILNYTIDMERPIAYKRFHKKVAHKRGEGFGPGRYPHKVCKEILGVLKNAVANAQYLNLDTDNLYIKTVNSSRAIAQARGGRYTNMMITVAEISKEDSEKKASKKAKVKN